MNSCKGSSCPSDLLHLCRLILAQYPRPRLRRDALEAVDSIQDLEVPVSSGARTPPVRLESWFADAHALAAHVRHWQAATGGRIVLYHDAGYPECLRHIGTPPVALFCEGESALASGDAVAIVGSRSASARACGWTRRLAADLAQMGVVIVSGLARGIDAASHEGACEAGGRTMAVVGNGTDVIYPPEHAALQQRIRRSGGVLSELPPGTAPRAWHFPSRNRILAGVARGVVVVQAEQRSGALITARHGLEENREVMAVPGDVEDPRSRGAHALLKQGATLVETAADVLAAIGWQVPAAVDAGGDRHVLLSLLRRPRTAESLRAALGWPSHQVQSCLTELELMGWVQRDAQGRFRRRGP